MSTFVSDFTCQPRVLALSIAHAVLSGSFRPAKPPPEREPVREPLQLIAAEPVAEVQVIDVVVCVPATKVCTKCGVIKSIDDFGKKKDGKYGRQPRCKECVNAYLRAQYEPKRKPTKPPKPPIVPKPKKEIVLETEVVLEVPPKPPKPPNPRESWLTAETITIELLALDAKRSPTRCAYFAVGRVRIDVAYDAKLNRATFKLNGWPAVLSEISAVITCLRDGVGVRWIAQ